MAAYTLNSDLGESLGLHSFGNDEQLMPIIDIANVACGYHAGDPSAMEYTVQLAKRHSTSVGAHPGLPDLVGFGRRTMTLTPDDVRGIITYQVGALQGFLAAEGMELSHIKPHGALYGMLAKDEALMSEAAKICARYGVPFFGLAGTLHEKVAKAHGVEFVGELYVDMDYSDDGVLIVGNHPEAKTPEQVAKRLKEAMTHGTVRSVGGVDAPVRFDSICVHSDGAASVSIARACRQVIDELEQEQKR